VDRYSWHCEKVWWGREPAEPLLLAYLNLDKKAPNHPFYTIQMAYFTNVWLPYVTFEYKFSNFSVNNFVQNCEK